MNISQSHDNQVKKTNTIKDKNTIYVYSYNNHNQLININMYEKKFFSKKFYGKYQFIYKNNFLTEQISFIEGLGVTEKVNYYFQNNELTKKEYHNAKGQLRYSIDFIYKENFPIKMTVTRMGKFNFFETESKNTIKKMIDITGKDFDGSFFLLELIDEEKQNDE